MILISRDCFDYLIESNLNFIMISPLLEKKIAKMKLLLEKELDNQNNPKKERKNSDSNF